MSDKSPHLFLTSGIILTFIKFSGMYPCTSIAWNRNANKTYNLLLLYKSDSAFNLSKPEALLFFHFIDNYQKFLSDVYSYYNIVIYVGL